MANYWVTTIPAGIALDNPLPDQARWQTVCENGMPLVFDNAMDWTGTPREFFPAHIGLGMVHDNDHVCDGECDPMLDRLAPDNVMAELADIVRAIR